MNVHINVFITLKNNKIKYFLTHLQIQYIIL